MIFGLSPNIQAIIKAKVVGHGVFEVIDRVPLIRDNDVALSTFEVKDFVEFKNVTFRYPKAPEKAKNVLDEASFKIKAGETTAIVGPSGMGKSTIV